MPPVMGAFLLNMRLSYTALKQQFLRNVGQVGSTEANLLADFNANLNNRYQMVWARLKGYQSQQPKTMATVDSQQYYYYPKGTSRIEAAVVVIGSVQYPLTTIYSQKQWDTLNAIQIQPTAIPQFIFPRRDDFGIWPIPRAVYTMTFNRHIRLRNLSTEDYSTGTVTMTNGDATVTGLATTFTKTMEGKFLVITSDADGYGYWYRIATYTSATALELDTLWEGATAGTLSYKICETPEIPEEGHIILCDGATADYYKGARVDADKASEFENSFWTGDQKNFTRDMNSKNVSGGLIGLVQTYQSRDDRHLIRRQPKTYPPSYKIWATSIT
jgi:hypothetical protein